MAIIEFLIIAIVFGFQIYFFRETFFEIQKLEYVFDDLRNIKIENAQLSRTQLSSDIGAIIIKFYDDNIVVSDFEETKNYKLIKIKPNSNETIVKIVTSINKYILKDKSKVVDFNIIKDIVERNCENIDGEINNQLPIPLYLGLAGTMFGIILGLFSFNGAGFFNSINNPNTALNPTKGIELLFGGVTIAMVASLCGLIFTIINTGIFYKKARRVVENDKNDFYTFIQTELLPTISQSVNSSIIELNHGLNTFIEKFDKNITQLEVVVNNNLFAIKSQNSLLDKINEIKPLKLTQANLDLFNRLDNNLAEFDKFNEYLAGMNNTLQSTLKLNDRLDDLLNKTDSLSEIVKAFSTNTENAIGIQTFIQSNLKVLTDREEALNKATTKIDILLQDSIKSINAHTQNSLEGFGDSFQKSLQTITNQAVDQTEILKNSIRIEEESFIQIFAQHQQKLKEFNSENTYLEKLGKLDEINSKLHELNHAEQIEKITSHIIAQNSKIDSNRNVLNEIKDTIEKQNILINNNSKKHGTTHIIVQDRSSGVKGHNDTPMLPLLPPFRIAWKKVISMVSHFSLRSHKKDV